MKEHMLLMLLPVGFWALGRFVPGLLIPKLHALFEQLRWSAWLNNPAKPKRLAWFKATLELGEDELPAPGSDPVFYDPAGAYIAGFFKGVCGSAKQWSESLAKVGDVIDTELVADEKGFDDPQPPTA